MRKLTVLVAVMLVAVLLAGCWVSPEFKLDYIGVEPEEVTLNIESLTGITEQLEVTAFYEYGTYTDVTLDCEYVSSDTKIVIVTDEGLVVGVKPQTLPPTQLSEPKLDGEATILVSYTQHNVWTGKITKTYEVKVTVEY